MPLPRSASSSTFTAVHVLGHRRRYFQAVLVEQVLAVHQDEDRDIERDSDELVLVRRDPLQQGPGEVAPVEIGQRQIPLAVVGLARIDGVASEQRRPGLVQVVEIVRAGLVPHVDRRLLQHLLQRYDFDFHLDARIGRELVPGQQACNNGGRRRLGYEADLRALVFAPDLVEPFRHLWRGAAVGLRWRPDGSRKRPAAAKHGGRKAGEADTGRGQAAQKRALADAPLPESLGTVRNMGLAVAVARTAAVTHLPLVAWPPLRPHLSRVARRGRSAPWAGRQCA